MALDGGLAAEGAGVAGVLRDFHLLHLLSEGSTISKERIDQSPLSPEVVSNGCRYCRMRWVVVYLVPYLPVTPTSAILISSAFRLRMERTYSLCASSFWRFT